MWLYLYGAFINREESYYIIFSFLLKKNKGASPENRYMCCILYYLSCSTQNLDSCVFSEQNMLLHCRFELLEHWSVLNC